MRNLNWLYSGDIMSAPSSVGTVYSNVNYNSFDYTNTSITKAYNIVLDALYNVYIHNTPEQFYINGRTFASYLSDASAGGGGGSGGGSPDITTTSRQIYENVRNKTCVCSYISATTPPHTYYTNGILLKNTVTGTYYVLTSFSLLNEASMVNNTTKFTIMVSNKRLFVCKVYDTDRMSNILIGAIDPYESDVTYYGEHGVVDYLADIEAYPFAVANDFNNVFLENTTSIDNGSNLVLISHNSIDTPMFSVCQLIKNTYYSNTLDAFSLQGILVGTEIRPNESGSILYTTTEKIIGILLLNPVYYDGEVNTYYSSQIATVSVALSSFVVNRILKRIFFGGDTSIQQLYLGIVYYPFTIESVMGDPIMRKYYAVKKELGGMVVSAVVRSYNPTTAKVGYSSSFDTGFIEYMNPLIHGTRVSTPNTDFMSIISYEADSNIIFDTITFFSKQRNANLTITLGRHYNQTSLSPLYYEYERQSDGLYPNVVLKYYIYFEGTWEDVTYTIINKFLAYKDSTTNTSANVINGDASLNHNNSNFTINYYQPLGISGERSLLNVPVLYEGATYIYVYVRVYSDTYGTLSFATDNANIAFTIQDTSTNPPTSVPMPIEYNGGYLTKYSEFLVTISAVSRDFLAGDHYDIVYRNNMFTAQTYFRLEMVFSSSNTITTSHLMFMPPSMRNNQNVGIFAYDDTEYKNIHSYNNLFLA